MFFYQNHINHCGDYILLIFMFNIDSKYLSDLYVFQLRKCFYVQVGCDVITYIRFTFDFIFFNVRNRLTGRNL